MTARRQVLRTLVAASLATTAAGLALAQDARPITILVGFAPGGAPDLVARTIAEKLQIKLKRNVIVDNKTGAGGQLALGALYNGPADGTQYALTPPGMLTMYPTIYPRLPYDVSKIEPVITGCTFEHAIVAGQGNPAKSLAEFVSWSKADPDKRGFYGIPALGTAPHFIGVILGKETGMKMTPVPYRGGPPMLQDLLGGQVPLAVNVLSNFTELHREGKLRVLATTGAKRSELLPDVPTVAELGYKEAQAEEWFAFVAKAGTPAAETQAFANAVRETLQMPDVRATLQKSGFSPVARGSAELREDIAAGTKKWARIIKETGFKPES
ncbi:tripartite tricarboxylate transporter substrate-binding protein [Piscinibacter sakaiensis]|uniref:tripartite tricarboxylate transporter substrate-binding protein n=1 Tax=Piscinibacter sakaiensis TaxID=1547922 RepID=UPI003AAD521A